MSCSRRKYQQLPQHHLKVEHSTTLYYNLYSRHINDTLVKRSKFLLLTNKRYNVKGYLNNDKSI